MIFNGDEYVEVQNVDLGEGRVAQVTVRINGDNDSEDAFRVRMWLDRIYVRFKMIRMPDCAEPKPEAIAPIALARPPGVDSAEIDCLKTDKSLALWVGLILGFLSASAVYAMAAATGRHIFG